MCGQQPDYLFLDGRWHCLDDYPLTPLIDSLRLYPGPGGVVGKTTGCSRGHVGYWRYEQGQLWLLDLRDPMDLSFSQTWLTRKRNRSGRLDELAWLAGERQTPLAVTWIRNTAGFIAANTDPTEPDPEDDGLTFAMKLLQGSHAAWK